MEGGSNGPSNPFLAVDAVNRVLNTLIRVAADPLTSAEGLNLFVFSLPEQQVRACLFSLLRQVGRKVKELKVLPLEEVVEEEEAVVVVEKEEVEGVGEEEMVCKAVPTASVSAALAPSATTSPWALEPAPPLNKFGEAGRGAWAGRRVFSST